MKININASQIRLNWRKYLGRPKLSNSEVVAPDKAKEEEEEYLYQNNPAIHVLHYFYLLRVPYASSKTSWLLRIAQTIESVYRC